MTTSVRPASAAQITLIKKLIGKIKVRMDHAINEARQFDVALVPTFAAQQSVINRLTAPATTITEASKVIDALYAPVTFIVKFPEYVNGGNPPSQYAEAYEILKNALKPVEPTPTEGKPLESKPIEQASTRMLTVDPLLARHLERIQETLESNDWLNTLVKRIPLFQTAYGERQPHMFGKQHGWAHTPGTGVESLGIGYDRVPHPGNMSVWEGLVREIFPEFVEIGLHEQDVVFMVARVLKMTASAGPLRNYPDMIRIPPGDQDAIKCADALEHLLRHA